MKSLSIEQTQLRIMHHLHYIKAIVFLSIIFWVSFLLCGIIGVGSAGYTVKTTKTGDSGPAFYSPGAHLVTWSPWIPPGAHLVTWSPWISPGAHLVTWSPWIPPGAHLVTWSPWISPGSYYNCFKAVNFDCFFGCTYCQLKIKAAGNGKRINYINFLQSISAVINEMNSQDTT
jgi:hypothetical protein